MSIHCRFAGERDDFSGASIYTLSNAAIERGGRALCRARKRCRQGERHRQSKVRARRSVQFWSNCRSSGHRKTRLNLPVWCCARAANSWYSTRSRAVRRRWPCLRAPDVPSVLFESGFVTNRADRDRLTTPEGQAQYAGVLARAIRVYFARRADVSRDRQ